VDCELLFPKFVHGFRLGFPQCGELRIRWVNESMPDKKELVLTAPDKLPISIQHSPVTVVKVRSNVSERIKVIDSSQALVPYFSSATLSEVFRVLYHVKCDLRGNARLPWPCRPNKNNLKDVLPSASVFIRRNLLRKSDQRFSEGSNSPNRGGSLKKQD
jgi:hypothetical protein